MKGSSNPLWQEETLKSSGTSVSAIFIPRVKSGPRIAESPCTEASRKVEGGCEKIGLKRLPSAILYGNANTTRNAFDIHDLTIGGVCGEIALHLDVFPREIFATAEEL